jgi:hypothetical protein
MCSAAESCSGGGLLPSAVALDSLRTRPAGIEQLDTSPSGDLTSVAVAGSCRRVSSRWCLRISRWTAVSIAIAQLLSPLCLQRYFLMKFFPNKNLIWESVPIPL